MLRRSPFVLAVVATLFFVHCGGSGGGLELSVDVRTDFAPGIEFDLVRTELESGGSVEAGAINSPEAIESFLRGRRVAEFDGLTSGNQQLEVSLIRARDGTVVASRSVVLALSTSTAVTVILARSCGDIACPGAGDAPEATECEAGICVTPECSEANPEACPETTTCDTDADCDGPTLAACATRVCSDSVCFVERDDSACEDDFFCDPVMGCIPIPVDGDGGMPSCIDGTPCERGGCEKGVTRCVAGEPVCDPDGPADARTVCRPADGECDAPETCDGTSTDCPDDVFAGASTECRASAGPCDLAESCNGDMPTCPADDFRPAGESCSAGGDAGFCDGLTTDCMTGCVPGAACSTGDACGIGELDCSGATPVCQVIGNAPSGTVCRASAGMCDVEETCTGSSPTCPDDGFRSGNVCRMSTGSCDATERCDGSGPACPSNAAEPNGTMCNSDDVGAWSGCAYSTTCDEDAPNETRTIVSYQCQSGVCQSSVESESRACSRDTDGNTCGTGFSCPGWGSCTFGSECTTSGTQSRTCSDQSCASGSCTTAFVPQMQGCTRGSQNGNACTTCGNPLCSCTSGSCSTVTTTVMAESDGTISFSCAGGATTCAAPSTSCSQTCPVGAPISITCFDDASNDNAVYLRTDGSLCTPCERVPDGGSVSCDETVTDLMDIDCGISERC